VQQAAVLTNCPGDQMVKIHTHSHARLSVLKRMGGGHIVPL
jgi:hypothetical protein